MNEFCRLKGIKREFNIARTPQQNRGVAERKNMTLIEAARTMLADSLLPTVFWAEAVNTACYEEKNVSTQQYIVFPLWSSISSSYKSSDESYKNDTADDAAGETPVQNPASENEQALKNVLDKMMKETKEQSDIVRKEFEAQCNRHNLSGKTTRASSTNSFNTFSTPVNAAGAPRTFNDAGPSFVPLGESFPDDPLMPDLEDTTEVQNTGIFGIAYDDDDLDTYNSPYADQVMGAEAVSTTWNLQLFLVLFPQLEYTLFIL
ncbi:putative ribonuclease H-like domain-containing protein, partial [Tanacetum coccineum]